MLADLFFSIPLNVNLPSGQSRTFDSVTDALDFLENTWPLRHGERHKRACENCRAALLRKTPAAVAREAFIAACLEASMSVQASPPSWQRSGHTSPQMSA